MSSKAPFDHGVVDEGASVASHYTNPLTEQVALAAGAAIVDMSDRDVVTVSGPDRLSWLTTLSTQVVDTLAVGQSKELLLLDAQGRIDHQAGIVDDGERAYLLTDVGRGGALAEFLESMRFMLRVEVAASDDVALIGFVRGGVVEAALDSVDTVAVWNDPWPGIEDGGTTYFVGEYPDVPRCGVAIVSRERRDEIASQWLEAARALGQWPMETDDGEQVDDVSVAGISAWEALRIAAYRPRMNCEVDERSVPHELDWLRTAVHLHKGCYCGQETVARIINLGRPPRRLVALSIDGSDSHQPVVGARITSGKRVFGRVTSVGYHVDEGWIGLGVVKRSMPADIDATIEWDDGEETISVATTVMAIVNPDGKADESPDSRPGAGVRRLPGSPGGMMGAGTMGL